MKKNYFLLAASTMMFAACAQTDLVNEVVTEETPQAIGFETFANKQTRADETPAEPTAENSSATYGWKLSDHHTTFKVWAYKNVSDTKVFDGREVTYTAASTGNNGTTIPEKWSYGTPVFWDKTATIYNFYAAAPSSAAWKFIENTTNKEQAYFMMENATLSATNFVTTPNYTHLQVLKGSSEGTDVDWMIADKCNIAPSTEDVPLNFIHILSRLNIIVKKKNSTDLAITLKSVTVKGLKLKGTFTEGTTTANASGTTERWAPASTQVTTDYKYETDFALTTDANYVLQSLVIPQNVQYQDVTTNGENLGDTPEAYLEIIYTINGEQFKAYYNLAAVFGAEAEDNSDNDDEYQTVAFNEGWQNTLTITIAPETINFTGNVATWADGTPANSGTIE